MPLVRIDTRALTYPWFWIPGRLAHFVDGSLDGGAVVDLPPGCYRFQQTRNRPSDLGFLVTDEGTVDFDARHDRHLAGRDTSTLEVRGLPVTIDPQGASTTILPMWGGCHEPVGSRGRTVHMPPGRDYEIRLGLVPSRIVTFSVRPDGAVDYGPEHERGLSGRGTSTLTLHLDRSR